MRVWLKNGIVAEGTPEECRVFVRPFILDEEELVPPPVTVDHPPPSPGLGDAPPTDIVHIDEEGRVAGFTTGISRDGFTVVEDPKPRRKPGRKPKQSRETRKQVRLSKSRFPPGRRPPTPPAVRARVAKLAAKGKSVREIMEATGLSDASVRRFSKPPAETASKSVGIPKKRPRTESKEWLDNPVAARKRRALPEPSPPPAEDEPPTPEPPKEDKIRVATMTNAEAVKDVLDRHFKGELFRAIAEKVQAPQPLVLATVHRAYVLMGEPFTPVGPANPRAKALWEEEMGPQGRMITARRIAEGR